MAWFKSAAKTTVGEAELEQYRQAAADLRHFDRFIWQNTIATVLTVAVAAGAVVVKDVSDGVRTIILAAVTIALLLMWIALHKHRFGTDTRTKILELVEGKWLQRRLIAKRVHRRTKLTSGEIAETAHVELGCVERIGAVSVLKFMLMVYIGGVLAFALIYFGAAVDWWALPDFLQAVSNQ